MCTVIIHVGESPSEPIRLVAIRDEDPARPWNPLGRWWPDTHSGVVGVRDVRAGGAWLAADPDEHRLAVLLNRADLSDRSEDEVVSRGSIVLASVAGTSPGDAPRTHGFNLVEVVPGTARVTMWDGVQARVETLAPGTHMIAHDDVDDLATARIAHWLQEFRRTPLGAADAETRRAGGSRGWTSSPGAAISRRPTIAPSSGTTAYSAIRHCRP